MSETITINILGETAREQWLSAINIMSYAVESNIDAGWMRASECIDWDALECEGEFHCGEEAEDSFITAKKLLHEFADEMRRLVEGVFE